MVEFKEIESSKIIPNRLNPRLGVNIERLNELADSIRQVGILEPIIVRPAGDNYEVVVGERRYRASQQVGIEKIPAIIKVFSDEQVIELNLIENIQREDLNAVEKGNCCKKLLGKYPKNYPSRDTLAEKIGVSTTTITNWLKLTEAPDEIQNMIEPAQKIGVPRERGKLDYSTALAITRQIEDQDRQVEVAKKIAGESIHGRNARKVVSLAARTVDRSVSEIIKDIKEEESELFFPIPNKELIMKGLQKQTTREKAPDTQIKEGKFVFATILEPRFAKLRILGVERKRLKYFTEEDAQSEGGYTLEEFRNLWIEKYGEWDEDQLVHIIRFQKD